MKQKTHFDGYIELDSGVIFNKDVSRKLIENAIREEKESTKKYSSTYL